MAPMYFAKILVLYPKRLKTSNVYYYKSVKALFSALDNFLVFILKDVAILNRKQMKIFMLQFLSASGLVGLIPMKLR